MAMDRLQAMTTLVRIADEGSFSAAARALQITPAAVSKQVARLEEHLGVRLVHRTTRNQTLTEAGLHYVERCRTILTEVDATERMLHGEKETPRGTLRITAPTVFGRVRVMPVMLAFMRAWPELRVDALFTDAIMDLAGAGIDLALRLASTLPDSALVGRRIGTIHRMLVASPAYLAARGVPRRPDDLMAHACLVFRRHDGQVGWSFALGSHVRTLRLSSRLASSDTEVLRAAALAGEGIADLPDYLVAHELAAGTLQPVLGKVFRHQQGIWALQPSRVLVPTRVTQFIALLERSFAGDTSSSKAGKPVARKRASTRGRTQARQSAQATRRSPSRTRRAQ